jgi:hypothetical protein
MIQYFTVTAPARRSFGLFYYYCAGRRWLRGHAVEVHVLDQDEDPVQDLDEEPVKLGRVSWRTVVNDEQLIKTSPKET